MFQYILKRILIFIPTLIVISLMIFAISLNAPGDPVEVMLGQAGGGDMQSADKASSEQVYLDMRKKLGLDRPVFYFSLSDMASSDTLHHVARKQHRQLLSRLTNEYGNWPEIKTYFENLRALELATYAMPKDPINEESLVKVKNFIGNLLLYYQDDRINHSLTQVEITLANITQAYQAEKTKNSMPSIDTLAFDSLQTTDSLEVVSPPKDYSNHQMEIANLQQLAASTSTAYQTVKTQPTIWKTYVPAIKWYGLQNQYHNWLSNFVQGDFGYSYQDKRAISETLFDRIRWTMLISFISILITYIIAVPIGVFSALKKGTKRDQFMTTLLFILYSLPSFWIATLLIMYLGGGDYLDWFPPYGIGQVTEDMSWWQAIKIRSYHLFLPLVCWTYATFAFLSRQMRGGMLSVIRQDYIRTARAKGLSESTVIWKHAFRNSLLPVITLFANVFPLMIGGSVVLEVIFTIPGMGKWLFDAIIFRDYPVVFTVTMLAAILTMIGYLVADVLYAVVDPRISFDKA